MKPRCGFISLVGQPNVGKSTLMNRLLGEPLAIVSPKPQTTWRMLRGILTTDQGQIIFIDTPGLHLPEDALGEQMVAASRRALSEADLIYWMVDCRNGQEASAGLFQQLLPQSIPVFLLLNKVDKISKARILPLIDYFSRLDRFREIIPLSALKGDNVEKLLNLSWRYLPAGPPRFPADQLSDQPERELMKEFIREQVFKYTDQEIPYGSAVKIEEVTERGGGRKIFIRAILFAERESQKGMLVGKGGRMIKRIGTASRRRIEGLTGVPVYLELRVKVRKKWRRNEAYIREFGFSD